MTQPLQMILGGGADAKPLIAAAHANGMRTVVVDASDKIEVSEFTDLECHLDPLSKTQVECIARQLGVTSIISTPSSHASAVEAYVGSRLQLM